jgi:hypothetical protein
MEAIALLLDDHKQLRALLSRLEKAKSWSRKFAQPDRWIVCSLRR